MNDRRVGERGAGGAPLFLLCTARPQPSDLGRNPPCSLLRAAHHLPRGEPEDGVAEELQVSLPARIGELPALMRRAVHFDDEPHGRNDEVRDVPTNDHLPLGAETESVPMPEDGP